MPMNADMARFYQYRGVTVRRKTPEIMELYFPDARCRHLTDDNRCAVYDSRPLICRRTSCYEAQYGEKKPEVAAV